jgi:dTDP-4-dehydrorhamnose 3,5-epimerase
VGRAICDFHPDCRGDRLKFSALSVIGSYLIEPTPLSDARGFFLRTFCQDEFANHGLNATVAQCSISYNRHKGTLRGLHYQKPPHEEAKLVRCIAGRVFDVVLDLRRNSPTYLRWEGVELNTENRNAIYVPEGCAHGFLTLADASEVLYQMSTAHHPEHASGVLWNDPMFAIAWPITPELMSERDRSFERWTGLEGTEASKNCIS